MTTLFEQWKTEVECGDVEAVRKLFDRHPELVEKANAQLFAFDSSAIFISRTNIEMVDLLLQHSADINAKTSWSAGGFGAAVAAALERP